MRPCTRRWGRLEELRAISSALAERTPGQVTFDLAELHGYAYHTGAVFPYAGQQGPPWPAAGAMIRLAGPSAALARLRALTPI